MGLSRCAGNRKNRVAEELAIVQERKAIRAQLAARTASKVLASEMKEQPDLSQRVRAQLREAQDLVAAKDAL